MRPQEGRKGSPCGLSPIIKKKHWKFWLAVFSTSPNIHYAYPLKKLSRNSSGFKSYGGQTEVIFHQFLQERRHWKKFLTLFDPPVTSQAKRTNSMGLYLVHLEELFPMPFEFFRSELYFRRSEGDPSGPSSSGRVTFQTPSGLGLNDTGSLRLLAVNSDFMKHLICNGSRFRTSDGSWVHQTTSFLMGSYTAEFSW